MTDIEKALDGIRPDIDKALSTKGYYSLSTMDNWAYGWNQDLHQAMLRLHRNPPPEWVISVEVPFGVHRWTIQTT